MRTLTYTVPTMSCAHCEAAIAREVSDVPGVETVAVDLEAKVVSVIGDDIDAEAVVTAINDAGYAVAP